TNIDISGALVFVGYGVSSPKNKYDDYDALDVKGKIVVIANGKPAPLRSVRLGEDEQADQAAAAHGAIGAIRIPEPQTILAWEQIKGWAGNQQQLGLPALTLVSGKTFPETVAGPALVKAIAKTRGQASADLS